MSVTPVKLMSSHLQDPSLGRVRLGAIVLSTDLVFEADAARLIDHDRAALHVARIGFENPTTPEQLRAIAPDLSRTASLLVPDVPLAAVAFACTSASVVIGNAAVMAAINAALPGVPVVTPSSAAIAGLAALGTHRVALLASYLPQTTEIMADYLGREGLEIVRAGCFGLADDRDMARIDDASLIEAAVALDSPEVEAFFISCTALRGVDVIDRIEARLGKPVVTSNQATCWALDRIAGLGRQPKGFGHLFGCEIPAQFAKGIVS